MQGSDVPLRGAVLAIKAMSNTRRVTSLGTPQIKHTQQNTSITHTAQCTQSEAHSTAPSTQAQDIAIDITHPAHQATQHSFKTALDTPHIQHRHAQHGPTCST